MNRPPTTTNKLGHYATVLIIDNSASFVHDSFLDSRDVETHDIILMNEAIVPIIKLVLQQVWVCLYPDLVRANVYSVHRTHLEFL